LDQPSAERPKPVLPLLVGLVTDGHVSLIGREVVYMGLEVKAREEVLRLKVGTLISIE
jgi:hypothetical protein